MDRGRLAAGVAASLVCGAVACGGGDDSTLTGPGAGSGTDTKPGVRTTREEATVAAGESAVQSRKCATCHGADMSGSTTSLGDPAKGTELYPPNLTNHDTGIKLWTDDQLATSIRVGFDRDGLKLCPQMTHFAEMTDYEAFSIVKYLRSLPPVPKKVLRSVCPPLKTKAEQSTVP